MSASHGFKKNKVKNKDAVQGQVIGDHPIIHQHFYASSASPSLRQQANQAQFVQAALLSLEQKHDFVDLLLSCACISDRAARGTVLCDLNAQFPGITSAIARRDSSRADVVEIISTCERHVGGLVALVNIVCLYEGKTSVHTHKLQQFLASKA